MIVGIDARAAAEERGGKGSYVRELVRHLGELLPPERLRLYARQSWDGAESAEWRLVDAAGLRWHLAAGRLASRECDVYLAPTSYLSPLTLRIPCVLVVHDLVVFDRRWQSERRATVIERVSLRPAARRARIVIADSESTQTDLLERLPRLAGKAMVIPPAAADSFSPDGDDAPALSRYRLERPYALAVGVRDHRKNIPRLIRAFERLPVDLREEYELVLAGKGASDDVKALASANGRVRLLGEVSDADLPALYRGADVFCFPSLYEGFGLPVLEAMRCGTAVVAAGAGSIPEVGGDAVSYVDPTSVEDIAAALEELLGDAARRDELAAKGLRHAARFRWAETARKTLSVLEEAAAKS